MEKGDEVILLSGHEIIDPDHFPTWDAWLMGPKTGERYFIKNIVMARDGFPTMYRIGEYLYLEKWFKPIAKKDRFSFFPEQDNGQEELAAASKKRDFIFKQSYT